MMALHDDYRLPGDHSANPSWSQSFRPTVQIGVTFFETQTLEVAVLDGLLQISGAQSRESRESGAERAASYQR